MTFRFPHRLLSISALVLLGASPPLHAAGPFPPAAGQAGSDAIAASDPRFQIWASAAEIIRGPVDASLPDGALAGFGDASSALGPPAATSDDPFSVVSLGDGGSATLHFDPPFGDGPGPDFAVFENSFDGLFLELAHVEVSSDGERFVRFPSISLTPIDQQVGTFIGIDPTMIHHLAGKHRAGFGTPFDLAVLRGIDPALDVERITHVRVVDVVGSIDPELGSRDSTGRLINDPYPTPFFAGGFDLDAVGAFFPAATRYPDWAERHGVEEPTAPGADGMPSLARYLTGGRGLEVEVSASGPVLSFHHLAYREDAELVIEASEDLKSWRPLTRVRGLTQETAEGGVLERESDGTRVRLTLPAGLEERFFRLKAEIDESP